MYNINSLLWGPHLWKFMHYLTLSYQDNPSEEEQNKFKNFFMMIGQYLPCEKCIYNYNDHIVKLPLTDSILQSRDSLIKWLFNLHNIVNKDTGKSELTFDKFLEIYIENKDITPSPFKYMSLIILSIILLILFIIYKKCSR